jgi:hypothetical protein
VRHAPGLDFVLGFTKGPPLKNGYLEILSVTPSFLQPLVLLFLPKRARALAERSESRLCPPPAARWRSHRPCARRLGRRRWCARSPRSPPRRDITWSSRSRGFQQVVRGVRRLSCVPLLEPCMSLSVGQKAREGTLPRDAPALAAPVPGHSLAGTGAAVCVSLSPI